MKLQAFQAIRDHQILLQANAKVQNKILKARLKGLEEPQGSGSEADEGSSTAGSDAEQEAQDALQAIDDIDGASNTGNGSFSTI